jgi:hypothetical protein
MHLMGVNEFSRTNLKHIQKAFYMIGSIDEANIKEKH